MIEVDGIKIPQSYAIARFVAKEAKLAVKNNVEAAMADALIDQIIDLNNAFDKVYDSEDEAVIVYKTTSSKNFKSFFTIILFKRRQLV